MIQLLIIKYFIMSMHAGQYIFLGEDLKTTKKSDYISNSWQNKERASFSIADKESVQNFLPCKMLIAGEASYSALQRFQFLALSNLSEL